MMRIGARLAVVAFAAILFGGVTWAQGTKIAVFDPQRVSEETAEGKVVKAQLEAFQAEKQKQLDSMQLEVQTMRKQLTEQALSLSADRKAALEKDVQRKIVELQSAEEAANRAFQLEISEAQNRFQSQLLAVLDAFGREEGFDLILDAQAVAFASAKVDVTTAIIDRFDKMIRTADAPPASGP